MHTHPFCPPLVNTDLFVASCSFPPGQITISLSNVLTKYRLDRNSTSRLFRKCKLYARKFRPSFYFINTIVEIIELYILTIEYERIRVQLIVLKH